MRSSEVALTSAPYASSVPDIAKPARRSLYYARTDRPASEGEKHSTTAAQPPKVAADAPDLGAHPPKGAADARKGAAET
eukprot:1593962-Rhodomonas_salina.1